MKYHEFQNYRRAPHPFQEYGSVPPASLKNRSIQQSIGAIPQGKDSFTMRVGKKQYNQKHDQNIKNSIFHDEMLNNEINILQKQKIKGKSLQTHDIDGAQGGSLKSPAVKNKQIAMRIMKNKNYNQFHILQYQQKKHRQDIEHAIKYQYENDVKIGKYNTQRGKGHLVNPQETSKLTINNNSKMYQQTQSYQKLKNKSFQSNDKVYENFFNGLRDQQESYDKFFGRKQQSQQYIYNNQDNKYVQRQQKRRQYNTINLQSSELSPPLKRSSQQYQPKHYPKKSLQSQFRNEQGLNFSSLQTPLYYENSRLRRRNEGQSVDGTAELIRMYNPSNLSTAINQSNLSRIRQHK